MTSAVLERVTLVGVLSILWDTCPVALVVDDVASLAVGCVPTLEYSTVIDRSVEDLK